VSRRFARGLVAAIALLVGGAARPDAGGELPAPSLATKDGGEIFGQICVSCHMADARGAVGGGHYPSLAANPAFKVKDYPARVVLFGRHNMPAFGAKHAVAMFYDPVVLSPAQIAAVVNYVRSHFGNAYKDAVTAADVERLDTK